MIYEQVSGASLRWTGQEEHEYVTFTQWKPSRSRAGRHCTGCMKGFSETWSSSFRGEVMSLLMLSTASLTHREVHNDTHK